MAKQKSHRPFQTNTPPRRAFAEVNNAEYGTGDFIGDWFRDRGIRETIESVLIAVMLALLFRSFEAEAFIIPTGSMAPSLQGEHIDMVCDKCNYQYRTGAANEGDRPDRPTYAISTFCPICRHNTQLKRVPGSQYNSDHDSNDGDRILANKFIYDFTDPKRWDVIIFKNPNNPKQNYIKRCVGLDNEGLSIEYGDIYTYDLLTEKMANRIIARKPPHKLWYMLQLVDDTNHIAEDLKNANWPLRWDEHASDGGKNWQINDDSDGPVYSISSNDGQSWLRYKHIVPRWYEWESHILSRELPDRIKSGYEGELIGDYYAYNHLVKDKRPPSSSSPDIRKDRSFVKGIFDGNLGLHWVGDLCLEIRCQIKSESGTISLDLVEGGVHFTCEIDIESGIAKLKASSDEIEFIDEGGNAMASPEGKTSLRGKGNYNLRFANCDDRLVLWVNKKPVKFGKTKYQDFNRPKGVLPSYSVEDPGDAQPAGIAASGCDLEIDRLKIYRDVYYRAATNIRGRGGNTEYAVCDIDPDDIFESEQEKQELSPRPSFKGTRFPTDSELRKIMTTPQLWGSAAAKEIFEARSPENDISLFKIEGEGTFMPMGDNSPESLDARLWSGVPYVDREYLSGRAMVIYWPHSLNRPPFFPNFKRMGFIH